MELKVLFFAFFIQAQDATNNPTISYVPKEAIFGPYSRTWFVDEGLHAQGKTWPGIHELAMKLYYKNHTYDLNVWQGIHRKNGTRYIDIIYTSKENILSALYYPGVNGNYDSHFYFYTPKLKIQTFTKSIETY
eukprot:UN25116